MGIIKVRKEELVHEGDDRMDDMYLTEEDYSIAAKNGISRSRAYQRFYQNGWDKERSITQPIKKGTVWKNYREKCEAAGITKAAFYSRIYRGMSPDEASITPTVPNGLSFKSLTHK
jgi:hypothetical protein